MTTDNSSENTEIDEAFVQNQIDLLMQQPAQYSLDTWRELEDKFDGIRVARRMSLAVLTRPFSEIHEQVMADRDFAKALADLYNGTKSTIERVRDLIELMECSMKWQMMALVCREDMQSIFEEMEAERVTPA